METKTIKKGRPSLYGERMKPNGLLPELDRWFSEEAERRGLKSGMELKRKVLTEWRKRVEKGE